MDVIYFKNEKYPKFQAEGNAAQFAIPYAKYFCKGKGLDIGCNRKEWSFPGSFPIDLLIDDKYDAFNLPEDKFDYIFSSHCLEHLENWVNAMDIWYEHLNSGGVLFLYLPHYDQHYWRPWNNRKHNHSFTPNIIYDYMNDKGYKNIFYSERDLNHSFMIVGEKKI